MENPSGVTCHINELSVVPDSMFASVFSLHWLFFGVQIVATPKIANGLAFPYVFVRFRSIQTCRKNKKKTERKFVQARIRRKELKIVGAANRKDIELKTQYIVLFGF